MTSEKKIEANRRNARKSTGPRTAKGKSASSQNAFKHGVLSKKAVSKREDRAAYEALLEQMIAEFKPDSRLESLLVERLTNLFWREKRLAEAEANSITRTNTNADGDAQFIPSMVSAACPDMAVDFNYTPRRDLLFEEQILVGRYQGMLGRQIREAINELRAEQDRRLGMSDQDGKRSREGLDKPARNVRQRSRPQACVGEA